MVSRLLLPELLLSILYYLIIIVAFIIITITFTITITIIIHLVPQHEVPLFRHKLPRLDRAPVARGEDDGRQRASGPPRGHEALPRLDPDDGGGLEGHDLLQAPCRPSLARLLARSLAPAVILRMSIRRGLQTIMEAQCGGLEYQEWALH